MTSERKWSHETYLKCVIIPGENGNVSWLIITILIPSGNSHTLDFGDMFYNLQASGIINMLETPRTPSLMTGKMGVCFGRNVQ